MLWLLGLSVYPRKMERKRALQPEGAHHPVVLGATETSCRVGANNERLLTDLTSACAAYPELVVILNVFDSPFPGDLRSLNCGKQTPSTAVPWCVKKVTHIPGMKTAFWRYGISPEVIARVAPHSEIVWLFDNDMRVGAADFDLRDAVASLLAAQVSAAQPRVQLESGHKRRSLPFRELMARKQASGEDWPSTSASIPLKPSGCRAQSVPWLEVQTPLIRRDAYESLHTKVLNVLDAHVFNHTVWGVSHIWCAMFARELPWRKGCAVLDTVINTNTDQFSTIEKTHKDGVRRANGRVGCERIAKRFPSLWPYASKTCGRIKANKTEFKQTRGILARGECLLRSASE